MEHWRRGDNGGEEVAFGRRGRRGTLKKAVQNVVDSRKTDQSCAVATDRSALPLKWPWCNKRPFCTAFQVAIVQQKAALHSPPLQMPLVQQKALCTAFQVDLVQQKAALHSLRSGPSATKGRFAQPSKWPSYNKRPLSTVVHGTAALSEIRH